MKFVLINENQCYNCYYVVSVTCTYHTRTVDNTPIWEIVLGLDSTSGYPPKIIMCTYNSEDKCREEFERFMCWLSEPIADYYYTPLGFED